MMFTFSCSRFVFAVLIWVNKYLKHFSAFIVNMVSICLTVFTKAIGRFSVFQWVYWLLLCCLIEQRFDCTHGFRRLQPITEKLGWSHSTYSKKFTCRTLFSWRTRKQKVNKNQWLGSILKGLLLVTHFCQLVPTPKCYKSSKNSISIWVKKHSKQESAGSFQVEIITF